jgi:hypothetical protein
LKSLPIIPVLPETAPLLKLYSHWFKEILKDTSVIMKGFPKTASSSMNIFPKGAANSVIKKIHEMLFTQRLSEIHFM